MTESEAFPSETAAVSDTPLLKNAQAGSLGVIDGNFKSLVTRRINLLRNTPGGRIWQRGYYERVVRNERELKAIRQYIRDNPQRWSEDRENLNRVTDTMDKIDYRKTSVTNWFQSFFSSIYVVY